MRVNIRAKNLELTPTMRKYIERKFGELDRYLSHVDTTAKTGERSTVVFDVEVARINKSSKKGDIFRAELNISVPGQKHVLRAESVQGDLYVAVDEVKAEMQRQLKKYKSKRTDKFIRVRRKLKKVTRISSLARFRKEK